MTTARCARGNFYFARRDAQTMAPRKNPQSVVECHRVGRSVNVGENAG